MSRSRRGQASVEYLLLLCSMVTVACLVGYFLRNYVDVLVDKIGGKILDAVFTLALG
ncbi:MAG: class III signal peptide-containing protein [Elusimicrobia bacterium]|nr:class III signal peptide-containing protein [Elusimicrobiota bacterium]